MSAEQPNQKTPPSDLSGTPSTRKALETFTPAEERFERWRRSTGLFLGPVVFVIVWFMPMPELSVEAHRLAAVVSLVVVWWVSEAIPIPATALLGAVLAVLSGIVSAREAFAPFASPTIFLFIGSFMIGRAVTDHGLDRRLAFSLLSLKMVQGSLPRIAITVAGLTMVLSAWMSNTATAAMMLPVAVGILTATGTTRLPKGKAASTTFLLSLAYSAAMGGVMTPVGTPPNLITLGLLDQVLGIRINFFTWMLMAAPISLTFAAVLFVITGRRLSRIGGRNDEAASFLKDQQPVGPWTAGQRNCAIAFGLAVIFWVVPGVVGLVGSTDSEFTRFLSGRLHESVVAVGAAALLFILPINWSQRRFTLEWSSAARIDWGTILLFGGGLSLGQMMFDSGLASHVGSRLVAISGAESLWTVTAMAIVVSCLLTEITSNTASTNMLVPVVISICQVQGLNPIPPALGVCLAASLAFMLPISTPPNAIIYGSGLVPITAMVRFGVIMDVIGMVIVFVGLRILCPLLGFV